MGGFNRRYFDVSTTTTRPYHGHMIEFLESALGLWIRVVPYLFISFFLLRSGMWPSRDEPRNSCSGRHHLWLKRTFWATDYGMGVVSIPAWL